MKTHEVCVIGAGWAGLTAASRLAESGRDVVLLEKARGPGGRCATRRQDGYAFDHGAQYFTVRSPAFGAAVEAWPRAGLVMAWPARIKVFGARPGPASLAPTERLVAVPGMNAVLKYLSVGLDCRYGWRASCVRRLKGMWSIETDDGQTRVQARYLMLTAPPQQAAELLAGQSALSAEVERVPMNPCWAVMLGYAQALKAGFDAAFDNEGPLAWLARDASKPGRAAETWVLHAGPEWSRQHLEDQPEAVAERLLSAFRQRLPAAALKRPDLISAHRWRYALSPAPLADDCLPDEDSGLVVAGDWCAGNRIEGAWSSGQAAAGRILSWLAGND